MDHYQALGLKMGASIDEIKRAYRTIALRNHPDKTLSYGYDERREREAAFKQACAAYEVLTDAKDRADYDAALFRQHSMSDPYAYGQSQAQDAASRTSNNQHQEYQHQQYQQQQQEEDGNSSPAFPALKSEDIYVQSHLKCMQPGIERVFGDWKYEIRVSKEFKMRATTEPSEWYGTTQNELYIRLNLDCVNEEKTTEDIYIVILRAPGEVGQFETYFKERDDSSCVLTLALHVYPSLNAAELSMPLPIELPVNIRLKENWVPFDEPMKGVTTATHLRFFIKQVSVPKEEESSVIDDEEMAGAYKVNVRNEHKMTMSYERILWQRIAEFSYARSE